MSSSGQRLIISGVVIFLAMFSLYSGMLINQDFQKERERMRLYRCGGILPWLLLHFPFLSAVAVTLQGERLQTFIQVYPVVAEYGIMYSYLLHAPIRRKFVCDFIFCYVNLHVCPHRI